MTTPIVRVNNFGHKNTARLRKMHKEGKLDLVFDRETSQCGIKIFKAYSKETGNLKAEFAMGKHIPNLNQHVWDFYQTLTFKQQRVLWGGSN